MKGKIPDTGKGHGPPDKVCPRQVDQSFSKEGKQLGGRLTVGSVQATYQGQDKKSYLWGEREDMQRILSGPDEGRQSTPTPTKARDQEKKPRLAGGW